MAGYYSVCSCGSADCPGPCEAEEPVDEELESLAETPEGQGMEQVYSADGRDYTPAPPAYLDPWWILRQRRRVQIYVETGLVCWPRVAA